MSGFEEYIRTSLQSVVYENSDFKTDIRRDARVLLAIDGTDMDRASRERDVLDWLTYYKVLRFFPPESSRKIAGEIIEFADERSQSRIPRDLVASEYEKLRQRLLRFVQHSPRTGAPRKVISLTSKALWCCYPFDVPLFDSHARSALQVISRLLSIPPRQNERDEYASFVDVWFQAYDQIESLIHPADGYPYKVRVFDRVLWYLGRPDFDNPRDDA